MKLIIDLTQLKMCETYYEGDDVSKPLVPKALVVDASAQVFDKISNKELEHVRLRNKEQSSDYKVWCCPPTTPR